MKAAQLREEFERAIADNNERASEQLTQVANNNDAEIGRLVEENQKLTEMLDRERLTVHKLNCDVVTLETNLRTQAADYEQQLRTLRSQQKQVLDEKQYVEKRAKNLETEMTEELGWENSFYDRFRRMFVSFSWNVSVKSGEKTTVHENPPANPIPAPSPFSVRKRRRGWCVELFHVLFLVQEMAEGLVRGVVPRTVPRPGDGGGAGVGLVV